MTRSAEVVGRTPWSARVPQDPLVHSGNAQPTGGSAADQGVRPTGVHHG